LILELLEYDKPKSLGAKLAEYLARPPQPILRFYQYSAEGWNGGRQLLLSVRNGLPLPLLYGLYVNAAYDDHSDYAEKSDHIGPFSTDDWRLTLDSNEPAQLDIRLGLVPFEIQTDRLKVVQ